MCSLAHQPPHRAHYGISISIVPTVGSGVYDQTASGGQHAVYVQQRLVRETQLEQEALDKLREALTVGPDSAMAAARKVLGRIERDFCYDEGAQPRLRH